MSPNKHPQILIIGAGLGGLALAQGLTRAGFDVRVFERDQSPLSRAQGYRISIRAMGLAALSALLPQDQKDHLESAKIRDVGDGVTIADEKMNPIFKVPQGVGAAVQFLRSELRHVLMAGIDVTWDKRLTWLEENNNQVIVGFEDGSQVTGDFVVACDGSGSSVRELLSSNSLPKIIPSGRAVFGGQISRTSDWDALLPLNQAGLVRFLGSDGNAMGVAFSERADRSPTVFWVLSEQVTDPHAPWYQFDQSLECRERLLNRCKKIIQSGSWHENLKKLVDATPSEDMMAPWMLRTTRFPDNPQYPMVPSGRVTLLGDAAHAMPPDKGLGGNNVLEDARLLSELLASAPKPVNWVELTAEYEKQMFERARLAVKESEEASQMGGPKG
jgi:2-polyprenyl-6-methoxyphenol hydroxylase-like FAD-dependent oxidoreductase